MSSHFYYPELFGKELMLCFNECFRATVSIDRMQKWLPINYSFIFVLISLTSLGCMRKIQKNFHTKMRLVSLISI